MAKQLYNIYKCSCCGQEKKLFSCVTFDDTRENEFFEVPFCHDCQKDLIGKRVNVIRYGNLPACGKSYNHRDGKFEDGISCYLQGMRPRPEFVIGRNKLEFSAIIIGWGGDDEPLIEKGSIK